MKWSELSMTERNEVIKMAVAQGIKDISSIKNLYEESINGSRRFEDGGDTNPAMTGMMKAKLATVAHFGNPTARRMTNYDTRSYTWPNEYEYDRGIGEPRRGNVYVGSYGNLVTPQIQDTGNGLSFIDNVWSPENDQRSYMQSLKFDNENDARYFGEHYKEIAPMMHLYADGGPKPVTTGGAGYIPSNYGQGAIDYVRRKLYNNILPWGYNDIPKRVYNAVVKNKKEEDETRDRAIRDDLWATYLQIPKNARHTIEGGKVTLTDASYKPKGAVKGKPTYKFSKLTSPAEYGILAYAGQVPGGLNIEGGDYLPIGKNRVVYPNDINAFSELEGLGQFTVGRGHDKKGEYVSYYDSWDLGDTNSPYKDMSYGIGKPFNVYDRIYLDDYYGIPKEHRGSSFLPEVVVEGRKKSDGGSIHIAPSKKGTFTAAASKHGMGVQEFASKVLSHPENYSLTMRKKANFARNASHWKH